MVAPLTPNQSMIYNRAVFRLWKKVGGWVVAFLLSCPAFAQNPGPPAPENTPNSGDAMMVTCGDKPPLASRTAKGAVLVAPDGKHRAYAEVEAIALVPRRTSGYTGPLCVNNSRLFVSTDSSDFKLHFLQEPADVETGNTLRLLDWSSDGRRLLGELAEWQYEQPGVTRSILIFDSRYETFQQPDLAHVLAKFYNRECSLNFHVLGFANQATIALKADPLTPEEEEVLGVSSCAKKQTYFEMDRATENIVSVPEMPKLQHNARIDTRNDENK